MRRFNPHDEAIVRADDRLVDAKPSEHNYHSEVSRKEIFDLDHEEARGRVVVEEGYYGPALFVPGHREAAVVVDLFYLSDAGADSSRGHHAQVLFHDQKGDVFGGIRYTPDGPRLWLESDVEEVDLPGCGRAFGRSDEGRS